MVLDITWACAVAACMHGKVPWIADHEHQQCMAVCTSAPVITGGIP
jgi:hypothetical protein